LRKRKYTRLLSGVAGAACALISAEAAADPPPPQLSWDRPVRCMTNEEGKTIRVQCETKAGQLTCLVASNEAKYGGDLGRTKECESFEGVEAYKKLVKEGAKMVEGAVAEAPPGFARAATGRAYQVKFDLLNRVYLGASWVPTLQLNQETLASPADALGRGQAELGIHISVLSHKGRSRHDIRILEGTATFADLELRGQLFAYDYQHVHRRPAFYLTSFFGRPRLYEVAPPLGWGFRVLRVADRPPALKNMELAEVHLAWNPWQSEDMYSHLRIEAGADIGKFWEDRNDITKGIGTGSFYAGVGAEAKFRTVLGDSGLHYVFLDLAYHRPNYLDGPKAGEGANNFTLKAAYEGIFIAVNDQPLSFRLSAEGASREDPFSSSRSLEVRAMAGLRFSFWAPPRVFEPLPEFEEP
jgi:hypothetical protein